MKQSLSQHTSFAFCPLSSPSLWQGGPSEWLHGPSCRLPD